MEIQYAVCDSWGELQTIIIADTRHQLGIAIDDWADEYKEGSSLQSEITERDWQTLNGCMSDISIMCSISGGDDIEVKGINVRDYTHFPREGE